MKTIRNGSAMGFALYYTCKSLLRASPIVTSTNGFLRFSIQKMPFPMGMHPFGSAIRAVFVLADALDLGADPAQPAIVEQVGGLLGDSLFVEVCPICGYHYSLSPAGSYQEVVPPAFSDDFYFFPASRVVWVGYFVSRVALWGSLRVTSSLCSRG